MEDAAHVNESCNLATPIELEPRVSRPLTFLPAPHYPPVNCETLVTRGTIDHRGIAYSKFDPGDQQKLFEALKLRCHIEQRLSRERYLTEANYPSWLDFKLPKGLILADFVLSPSSSSRVTRRVVAIDCEMVGVGSGIFEGKKEKERNEIAQLCAIDVLTGDILINKLVLPRERVLDWRTRYSGVSYPRILAARDAGKLLRGWQAARAELLNFVDSDTILMGHSLYNDLHILRLAHGRIIDTAIQTAEAVNGDLQFGRHWGLKDLSKTLLGISIQISRKGHDCIEDTLATRELAIWCICNAEKLREWAARMRVELEEQRVARKKKFEEEIKKRQAGEAEALEKANTATTDQGRSQLPLVYKFAG